MLEALVVDSELNVDAILVQGNHFLQVHAGTPLLLAANQRNVINGKKRVPMLIYLVQLLLYIHKYQIESITSL